MRDQIDALPDAPLARSGELATLFWERSVKDFRGAARYVQRLPYGRNTSRGDVKLVLAEARGTCSSKHALLAALAREQQIDVVLTLGIFNMSEANTPGVGRVLKKYGVDAIPEAHCYLTSAGHRVDVTSANDDDDRQERTFVHEEVIQPEQVERYKPELHRSFLTRWIAEGGGGGRSLESVWKIREECIAALSD